MSQPAGFGTLQTYPGEQPHSAFGPLSCGVTATPGRFVGFGQMTRLLAVTIDPGFMIVDPGIRVVLRTGGKVIAGPGGPTIVETSPGIVIKEVAPGKVTFWPGRVVTCPGIFKIETDMVPGMVIVVYLNWQIRQHI
jgi:hypothetical protein